MRKVLYLLGVALFAGLLPTSCADPGYQPVAHGGVTYYYLHGSYYRRYWYGYRPCPKPPGIPEHPIARPPNRPDRPDRPTTLPANQRPQSRPSTRPATRPVTQPAIRPAPRPAPRPALRR